MAGLTGELYQTAETLTHLRHLGACRRSGHLTEKPRIFCDSPRCLAARNESTSLNFGISLERTRKEIRRFETLAADGSKVTVIEFQWVRFVHVGKGSRAVKTRSLFCLTDGSEVWRNAEDQTYRVFNTNQVLRRSAKDAGPP